MGVIIVTTRIKSGETEGLPTMMTQAGKSVIQMNNPDLTYPEDMLPRLRFRFCPMCASPLRMWEVNGDGMLRPTCPACGWVHYPSSAIGVVVVVHHAGGIVAILPHNAPPEAPAVLPSKNCEYGEAPEDAARREVRTATGLEIELIHCFGSMFSRQSDHADPNLIFMYEARSTGGNLTPSGECSAAIFSIEDFPAITPRSKSSRRAWQAFLTLQEDF